MTRYAWMLQQVPVIIAHLRDSMIPLAATVYDRTRVDGTREQPLPFRIEPMQDADALWAALTAYGNQIARVIHPAPHALTARLRASQQWYEAGDAAYTITAWLIAHEDRIGELDPETYGTDDVLFLRISQLLNRYRITPRRLRIRTVPCATCGADAVYAEWTTNRDGDITQSVQCTVCHRRYEVEEVTDDPAHLPASSEESEPLRDHHQTVAS